MAQETTLDIAGLHTTANQLSAVPAGAMKTADNIVIRSQNVAESRRGQSLPTYTLGGTPSEILGFYQDQPIVLANLAGGTLYHDTGAAYTAYPSTYAAPDSTLMRTKAAEAQKSFYFTTSAGIYKLDSLTGAAASGTTAGNPRAAGGLKTAGWYAVTGATTGASGFMSDNTQVAYRVVFGYTDANGIVQLGPPSGRVVVANTSGGTRNVSLYFPVPPGATTAHYYQIYRSAQSPSSTTTPNDELQLVYWAYFTASQLFTANAYVTLTESTPDAFKGAYLYTNAISGEGIAQANEPPPFAYDVAPFGGRMLYANTNLRQRFYLDLLGVGGNGLRLGDTLTFGSTSFRAWTGTDPSHDAGTQVGEFLLCSTGSVTQNVEWSASALVEEINRWYDNTLYRAEYLSTDTTAPGKILIETFSNSASAFAVTLDTFAFSIDQISRTTNVNTARTTAQHGLAVNDTTVIAAVGAPNANFDAGTYTVTGVPTTTTFTYTETKADIVATAVTYTEKRATPAPALAWNPPLPTSGSTVTSSSDAAPNRIYYSKFQQPEAVPLLNYVDVGPKNRKILRIVPLRDKVFVFKEEGIYTLSGDAPYRVDLFDGTARIIGPDTAAVLHNSIYALTNQGLISVSAAGVRTSGLPVEADFLTLFGSALTATKRYSFGFGYDSERLYGLWLPAASTDTYATRGYLYNALTGTWVKWPIARSCGRVHPTTDTLYMGHVSASSLWVERKAYDNTDFYDETYTTTVTSSSGTTLTLGATGNIGVGDIVSQSSTIQSIVVSVDSATQITVLSTESWSNGATVTIYKAINCDLEWVPFVLKSAHEWKHVRECHALFARYAFSSGSLNFYTDLVTTSTAQTIGNTGWGQGGWGNYPWGQVSGPKNARTEVPLELQRGVYHSVRLNIKEALSNWKLNGVTLVYEPGSERTSR